MTGSGLSHGQIAHLAKKGEIVRMHRGVYRKATEPPSWQQRLLAACLAIDGVASHRSAQRLWSPDSWPGDRHDGPVEVTVPRRRAPRLNGAIVHRSADFDRRLCLTRYRIPVTTPMRMLLDLGAVAGHDQVAVVLDRLVLNKVLAVDAVRKELETYARPGRSGVTVLRQVLAVWPADGDRAESAAELDFLRICDTAGLPAPQPQYPVVVDGRQCRLDFAYPGRRIAIEIDGFAVHASREAFQGDRARQNALVQLGRRVFRFTWHDLTQRPDHVASSVRTLLETA